MKMQASVDPQYVIERASESTAEALEGQSTVRSTSYNLLQSNKHRNQSSEMPNSRRSNGSSFLQKWQRASRERTSQDRYSSSSMTPNDINSKKHTPVTSQRKKKPINRHDHHSLCSSIAFATIEEKKESALKLLTAIEHQSERHFRNNLNSRQRHSVSTHKMVNSVDLSAGGGGGGSGNHKKDDKGASRFGGHNNNYASRPPAYKNLYIKRIDAKKDVVAATPNNKANNSPR